MSTHRQLELGITIEAAQTSAMPEHLARQVMSLYGALSTRMIAARYQQQVAALEATSPHLLTLEQARAALMAAACAPRTSRPW